MWVLVSFSLRFACPALTLLAQLEKLDAERLDWKFIKYHICIVVGVLFVGLERKHLFSPRALIIFQWITTPPTRLNDVNCGEP